MVPRVKSASDWERLAQASPVLRFGTWILAQMAHLPPCSLWAGPLALEAFSDWAEESPPPAAQ